MLTLVAGLFVTCCYMGAFPTPLIGIAIICFELHRSHKIAALTAHISPDTIRDFYRSDRSTRYFGASETAKLIEEFARSHPKSASFSNHAVANVGRQAP